MKTPKIIPVIISGGSGSRLWPFSTGKTPKPFLPLFPDGSLMEKTLLRLAGLQTKEILFITNQKYFSLHQQTLQKDNIKKLGLKSYFLLEQEGRNTAPAVLMAAKFVQKHWSEETVLLVLPADHSIETKESFADTVSIAVQQAKQGGLITFGIPPSYPETGYGYLCTKKQETVIKSVVPLERFVEKPDIDKAKKFLEQKNYFWNSGIFCFSTKVILEAFADYQKPMLLLSEDCLKKSTSSVKNTFLLDAKTFSQMESISLDYAIMEKHQEVYTVPAKFSWSDIGSWTSVEKILAEQIKKDEAGNLIQGDSVVVDCQNTFFWGKQNVVGLVGLKDLTIIEKEGFILIAHKDKVQETKKVFEALKQKEAPEKSNKK